MHLPRTLVVITQLRAMPALSPHTPPSRPTEAQSSWVWRPFWTSTTTRPVQQQQHAAARSFAASTTPQQPQQPQHLVVLVNGLFGHPGNWDVTREKLLQRLDRSTTLLHVSAANTRAKTFDGIDTCGQRLAQEVCDVVAAHPSLRSISFVGHSMGGLLARCAIGRTYDPATGRVAGLEPRHYVSMATPHLGCDVDGPAQVPLIGWVADLPVPLGRPLQSLMSRAAAPVTSTFLSRSGRQFFLQDSADEPPLLYRMTRDCPEAPYLSALAAFKTRTAYANCSGDHLVGWANSSLRWPHQLKDLQLPPQQRRRGVVRQDALHAAFEPARLGAHAAAASGGAATAQHKPPSRSGSPLRARGMSTASSSEEGEAERQVEEAERQVEEARYVPDMLRALSGLPWRRVDVCFREASVPLLAHNHIQVTRKWINLEGEQVVEHLAEQLAAMESLMATRPCPPLAQEATALDSSLTN